MKKLKRVLTVFGALMLLCVIPGITQAETITWKIGYGGLPNDPTDGLIKMFQKKLEDVSEGRFKTEVQYSASMGYTIADALRYLKQGLGQSAVVATQYLARDEPMLGALLPNGALLEKEDNEKLFDYMKDVVEKVYNKWGLTLTSPTIAATSVYWYTYTKEPVNSLEQLKGKKMRHSDKIEILALNKLGIPAQFVSSSDSYMAMKTGVLDGTITAPVFAFQDSTYEVTKYFSRMGPYSTAYLPGIAASLKAWNSLPKEHQEYWTRASKEFLWDAMYSAWVGEVYEKEANKALLEKGMTELPNYSLEDRKKLQKAVLEVWLEQCQKIGPDAVEHYNKVLELLNQ